MRFVIALFLFTNCICDVANAFYSSFRVPRKDYSAVNLVHRRVNEAVSISRCLLSPNRESAPPSSDQGIVSKDSENKIFDSFLEQLEEMSESSSSAGGSRNIERFDVSTPSGQQVLRVPVERKVVEMSTHLGSELPIEFFYKGRISFGNILNRKRSLQGISVRLTSGDIVTIDVGQITSVWDMLADEDIPASREDWARIAAEAFEILGRMSPRKSNLEEFWRLVLQRPPDLSIDSLDLGIYIFQEACFKSWINPRVDAIESNAVALTAAQRYAAALILHNDDFHFKRRTSTWGKDVEIDRDGVGTTNSDEYYVLEELTVVEGGYRVLDESMAMFKQGEVFEKYYQSVLQKETEATNKSNNFRAGCITRQLRSLEVYAMSPATMAPPVAVKHILKRLQKPTTPAGAMEVIKTIKFSSGGKSFSGYPFLKPAVATGKSLTSFEHGHSVTPWPDEVLSASQKLCEDVEKRRVELREEYFGRVGKRGPTGRMDFRGNNIKHPVMCIDSKRASFLDDAFSFSPETGEIMVHVADVVGVLRRYEPLMQIAKERVSSTFLPTGPLHMLPPQALEALKLSSSSPNEVITAAFKVNYQTGCIDEVRVFPSVVGPVFAIDIESADELLEKKELETNYALDIDGQNLVAANTDDESDLEEQKEDALAQPAKLFGYPTSLLRDLLTVKRIMARVIAQQPWIDAHFSQGVTRDFKFDKKTGIYQQSIVEKTTGNRLVNALLSLYSNATVAYCDAQNVNVPIAWENRDRLDSNLVRRFATQPLRNWLSQLQQKQLRAALRMEMPVSRKECAMAVSYVNNKRRQVSSTDTKRRDVMSFESLEAHCATMASSGQQPVVLFAEGVGKGGEVRISDFRVMGVVNGHVPKGARVKVAVKKIVFETKSVLLELIE